MKLNVALILEGGGGGGGAKANSLLTENNQLGYESFAQSSNDEVSDSKDSEEKEEVEEEVEVIGQDGNDLCGCSLM